jgi:hypothetical protein
LPSDSDAARLRLDSGNRDSAALLDHVKDESGVNQQIIAVDRVISALYRAVPEHQSSVHLPRYLAARTPVYRSNLFSMRDRTICSLSASRFRCSAFVAFGAIFATTVTAGSVAITAPDGTAALSAGLPYGIARLLTGLVFCVGLVLVIVGGAELFTGNTLIVMAWASGKIKTRAVLLNWVIAFSGNFIGSLCTAGLIWFR